MTKVILSISYRKNLLMNTYLSALRIIAITLIACFAGTTIAADKDAKAKRVPNASGVLPANPGLDGGKGGHWGLKGDKDWVDSRWNKMDTGPFMSSSLETPGGVVKKAISIRLGDKQEASICFDAEQMAYRVGWLG